jgi:hypothetical protein
MQSGVGRRRRPKGFRRVANSPVFWGPCRGRFASFLLTVGAFQGDSQKLDLIWPRGPEGLFAARYRLVCSRYQTLPPARAVGSLLKP